MKYSKILSEFGLCLVNKDMMPTALKVSFVVGSILFVINHGSALVKGEMNRDRWISAGVTYVIPYMVNIHGQYISAAKRG